MYEYRLVAIAVDRTCSCTTRSKLKVLEDVVAKAILAVEVGKLHVALGAVGESLVADLLLRSIESTEEHEVLCSLGVRIYHVEVHIVRTALVEIRITRAVAQRVGRIDTLLEVLDARVVDIRTIVDAELRTASSAIFEAEVREHAEVVLLCVDIIYLLVGITHEIVVLIALEHLVLEARRSIDAQSLVVVAQAQLTTVAQVLLLIGIGVARIAREAARKRIAVVIVNLSVAFRLAVVDVISEREIKTRDDRLSILDVTAEATVVVVVGIHLVVIALDPTQYHLSDGSAFRVATRSSTIDIDAERTPRLIETMAPEHIGTHVP